MHIVSLCYKQALTRHILRASMFSAGLSAPLNACSHPETDREHALSRYRRGVSHQPPLLPRYSDHLGTAPAERNLTLHPLVLLLPGSALLQTREYAMAATRGR